jgi:hypothetical protein
MLDRGEEEEDQRAHMAHFFLTDYIFSPCR